MSKILGLDLGTNSIGWAVVEREFVHYNGTREEQIYQPEDTIDRKHKGVLVFPEGVKEEKGNRLSRAAERTGYRSARKLKFRRKLRKYETLTVLWKNGMCPIEKKELEEWRVSKDPETGKKRSFKNYPNSTKFLDWLKTDEESKKNPYFFRDKFSRKKYDWENNKDVAQELGRAFYHMAQRRGFASNREEEEGEDKIEILRTDLMDAVNGWEDIETIAELRENVQLVLENHKDETDKQVKDLIKKSEKIIETGTSIERTVNAIEKLLHKKENLGPVKKEIAELSQMINDAGCDTLGQYFYQLYKKDRNLVNHKIRTWRTDREEHYKAEFDQICETQDISGKLKTELTKAIFYQRPLKSQKGLVGKCTFEGNKPRCPVSHPAYEEYRMWTFINNIKVQTPGDEDLRPLKHEEIERIKPKFYRRKNYFPFSDIAQALFPDNNYKYIKSDEHKNETNLINYKPDTTVSGSPVTAAIMGIFGRSWDDRKDWKSKLYNHWKNKECRDGRKKNTEEVVNDFWHALFTAELLGDRSDIIGKNRQEKLKDFAKRNTTLGQEEIDKFSKIRGLKKDYASLSQRAIYNILPWLKEGLIYPHAVFMANMHNVVDKNLWENKKDRENIKEGLKEIIKRQEDFIKQANVVNAQLADMKKNGGFSEEALSVHENELESRLIEAYGQKTWNQRSDKESLLSDTLEKFKKQAVKNNREGEYLKKQREDEAIKSFLLGFNDDGEVYCRDEKLLKKLYHPSDLERFQPETTKIEGEVIKQLGSPRIAAIKNPVVMRTLHQLRKLINELLREGIIDKKTKLHIEMARELNDANKRAAIEQYQKDRRKQREIYRNKIQELYHKKTGTTISPTDDDVQKFGFWIEQDPNNQPPIFTTSETASRWFSRESKKQLLFISERDIEKYQYWDEQHHRCIYTGNTIAITDFIGRNPKYDIEHTIPRSVSYDNSQKNKTLCELKFNREHKKEKIPTELRNHTDILNRIEKWKGKFLELEKQIEYLVKRTKGASTKEQKDRLIQERHYLTLHRDYWKGKYQRFVMEEIKAGFKNSQKVDTGIITKYAREYLGSIFKNRNGHPNVFAVNGSMVDQFRKAWGLHEKEMDENGNVKLDTHGHPVYKEKDRSNHVHHCIDAVTVACMTREKYDKMAHAWQLEDKWQYQDARRILENSKPWDTFTEDVTNIENEVMVVHAHKDNVPKQTKKKKRIRGKIQYQLVKHLPEEFGDKIVGKDYFEVEEDGQVWYKIPKFQQGDTARGSLHKDTFYGAIKQPELDRDTGKPKRTHSGSMLLEKDKKGKDKVTYVKRERIEDLKDSDLDKIIDPKIKEIVKKGRTKEKEIRKEIEQLKKELQKSGEGQAIKIKDKIEEKEDLINTKLYSIPPKKGKKLWTPIRNIRINKSSALSEPLPNFKEHRDTKKKSDGTDKYPHKKWVYVQNDKNYCLALYENEEQTNRSAEIVNLLDAVDYFKLSNKEYRQNHPLVEQSNSGKHFKALLKPGTLVLFYKEVPQEIWDLEEMERRRRLYFIRKTSKNGQTTFQYHQEARNDNQLKEDFEKRYGKKPTKSLTNGESSIDFGRLPIPRLLLSPVNMKMLIEEIDFKITYSGIIKPS